MAEAVDDASSEGTWLDEDDDYDSFIPYDGVQMGTSNVANAAPECSQTPLAHSATSQFTRRHLRQMRMSTPTCPLRVIALIDFDAFYAQCEMVRLGLPTDQPLAVQQWNAIIALNYPARDYGLKRGIPADEAKLRCPTLHVQHVATWRRGEPSWAYRADVRQHMSVDKAALDPYRLESRKALALVVKALPELPEPRVEKASVDEMFIDLSAHVYGILLERYPVLAVASQGLGGECLPLPTQCDLDWVTDHVLGVQTSAVDWDDVALSIGSGIVRVLRQAILDELHYTTSAGVAHNKMVAKLAAGHKKPNQQTVIRHCAVSGFLSPIPYKKIRGLARKLGGQVQQAFGGDIVADLLATSLPDMKLRLGAEQGLWVHNVLRGIDESEVVSRTHIQSMLSQKTFVPDLRNLEEASTWLRMFAAELHDRVLELDTPSSRRRPKTLTIYHHPKGRFGPTYSKQVTIPLTAQFNSELVYTTALIQLRELTTAPSLWPCAAIGLRLSNLVEVEIQSHSIKTFFSSRQQEAVSLEGLKVPFVVADRLGTEKVNEGLLQASSVEPPNSQVLSQSGMYYQCPHCSAEVRQSQVLEHLDWHVAMELQDSVS